MPQVPIPIEINIDKKQIILWREDRITTKTAIATGYVSIYAARKDYAEQLNIGIKFVKGKYVC